MKMTPWGRFVDYKVIFLAGKCFNRKLSLQGIRQGSLTEGEGSVQLTSLYKQV
jgi:hypothetical protein